MPADTRILFVSPHFDDVVLSCASYLADNPDSLVATVCSGVPHPDVQPTPWDARSGFESGLEAAIVRRTEDRRALHRLNAQQVLLGFYDGPYSTDTDFHESASTYRDRLSAIVGAIGAAIEEHRPTHCAFPLGVYSDDHIITRRAALSALGRLDWCRPLVYADLPYTLDMRPAVRAQLGWLGPKGRYPLSHALLADQKHRVFSCYRSQEFQLASVFKSEWAMAFEPGVEQLYVLNRSRVHDLARRLDRSFSGDRPRSPVRAPGPLRSLTYRVLP